MVDHRKYLGQAGEEYACRFIEDNGLEVLERNWRDSRRGELDILAREGRTAVVVEVRTRIGTTYGSALESVAAPCCPMGASALLLFQAPH